MIGDFATRSRDAALEDLIAKRTIQVDTEIVSQVTAWALDGVARKEYPVSDCCFESELRVSAIPKALRTVHPSANITQLWLTSLSRFEKRHLSAIEPQVTSMNANWDQL
jgi:hypothetical protein